MFVCHSLGSGSAVWQEEEGNILQSTSDMVSTHVEHQLSLEPLNHYFFTNFKLTVNALPVK